MRVHTLKELFSLYIVDLQRFKCFRGGGGNSRSRTSLCNTASIHFEVAKPS